MSLIIKEADKAFSLLNGVFCVFKSKRISYKNFFDEITTVVAQDLNQLKTRPINQKIKIVGDLSCNENFYIQKYLSLSDHPLVVGERYTPKNIPLSIYHNLSYNFSGVNLIGIGSNGCRKLNTLRKNNLLKEYEIDCQLGIATDNFYSDGKVISQSKYLHVTKNKINILLSRIVTSNKNMIMKNLQSKVDSQEVYEVMSKGIVRPEYKKSNPVIYNLECFELKPPIMKLRLHILNENPLYILNLVNAIGLRLRTHACSDKIICTKIDKFGVEDCLTYKELNLENIFNNINKNYEKVQHKLNNQNFISFSQNINFTTQQNDKKLLPKT